MDFPTALSVVLTGGRVRRKNWLPGAFLIDVPGSTITVEAGRPLGDAAPELLGTQIGYRAHVDACADGEMAPWSPSQEEMHAHDWEVL